MKKVIQFAIQYPVTVSMIVLGVLLLGFISLRKLSIDLFPEMNAPRIFVEFKAGERPPEEIEKQFVENAEALAIRLKGVADVSSVCMVGAARLTIEYNWGTDMDEAFLDLQKGLSMISQNSEITEFNITQHDPNASPVMLIAMVNPAITDMDEMRKTGQDYIRNELIRLEGIADVNLTGTEEREIVIETNPYQLAAFGVSADLIVSQIQSMNRSVSGGSIVEMGTKYIIKGNALVTDVQDIGNIIITYKQGTAANSTGQQAAPATQAASFGNKVPVYLRDVAKVYVQNKKPENIVRVNGKRCVGLSVYKETGYNTAKAVDELAKSLETIKKALPGYQFIIVQNQGKFINDSIGELRNSGLIGVIITIFVLFIFLRRIGVTLIVSAAMVVSVIATFNLMYFNGLSINLMTLGGLALGIGMLVDNAVVVIENISRKRESGLSVWDASIAGANEVAPAVISSTITTIVVFLPIVYLHGTSRALFKDQAWTVAFSLIASLFAAIFVIPMLYNWAYSGKKKKIEEVKSIHFSWYSKVLAKIIDRRGWVIAVSVMVLAGSALILPKIGSEYLPKSGSGEISVEIKLKEGTQLQRTDGLVQGLETMLGEMLGNKAEIIYSQAGPSGISSSDKAVFQNENSAFLKIKLAKNELKNSQQILGKIEDLLSTIPDVEINIIPDETALQSTLGTNEAPVKIEVEGEDIKQLEILSEEVKQKIIELPGLTNVETSIENGAPEVDVVVDRTKASLYGLTTASIISQLKDMLMGKDAGKFQSSVELNDITLRMPEVSLAEFHNIMLSANGSQVPLYEVAQISESTSPKQLLRRNQKRIATVTADIKGDIALDKIVAQVKKKIDLIQKIPEYQIRVVGEESKRQDAMSSLGFALLLSVILVYMVMASQFESLIHPFTILLTIPLAGAGALWTFFLIGKPLNMMAYIGIIMLAGIAVNNSILLVDAINRLKAEGLSLRDAIINAGQNRIRPILMTSLTTIVALIPLVLGIGEGASLRTPMAIAVISGLTFSTMVSLVVIPCVYYVFDRKKK